MTGDPIVTLTVTALILLAVAAVAFAGFLYLLLTERRTDPEPPAWVNDGRTRRPCDRPRTDWRCRR